MGQFYKTAKPQFVDDFMYQPPYELIQQVMAKRDAEAVDKLSKIALLGDLNFDYSKNIKNDVITANKVSDKWNTIADDITDRFSKNIFDPSISSDLAKATRDLKRDWQEGDIYKLGENYRREQTFLAKMDKALAGNDARKQEYRDKFLKPYYESGSALTGLLDEVDPIDRPQIWKDFLDSSYYTKIEPIVGGKTQFVQGYKYNTNQSKEWNIKTKQMLQDAFNQYVRDNNKIKSYAYAQNKIFNEDGWLDDNGNVLLGDNSQVQKIFDSSYSSYTRNNIKDTVTGAGTNPDYISPNMQRYRSVGRPGGQYTNDEDIPIQLEPTLYSQAALDEISDQAKMTYRRQILNVLGNTVGHGSQEAYDSFSKLDYNSLINVYENNVRSGYIPEKSKVLVDKARQIMKKPIELSYSGSGFSPKVNSLYYAAQNSVLQGGNTDVANYITYNGKRIKPLVKFIDGKAVSAVKGVELPSELQNLDWSKAEVVKDSSRSGNYTINGDYYNPGNMVFTQVYKVPDISNKVKDMYGVVDLSNNKSKDDDNYKLIEVSTNGAWLNRRLPQSMQVTNEILKMNENSVKKWADNNIIGRKVGNILNKQHIKNK